MKKLLIIAHTPSKNTQLLADALLAGASHADISNVEPVMLSPFMVMPEHVLAADGIVLFTTENFGYMSGAMKDFFDRCYYPCLEQTQALPYALVIRAGLDGTGTKNAVTKIITGLRWKEVQEVMICQGEFQQDFISQCEELGMGMAAGLESGIF